MYRIILVFIVIPMLAGCTTAPTPSAETIQLPTANIVPTGPAEPEAETQVDEATLEIQISPATYAIQEYPVPAGSHPHDVAPAPDGAVWYTAQRLGELGRLDPATGETHHIPLGSGSAPHGVIVGPDGAAWVTDGGLNAIVRVDPETEEVRVFPLPRQASMNW